MCNIAGYVGTKPAAPILIEMLRKQEGLDAGCYTGIATIHEGKIYYAKVVGDLEQLLSRTDAASLPGTIGIIHSRTPGDTGDEWAHPFVCEKNGEYMTALVANGTVGCFTHREPDYIKIAESLLAEGYHMRSALPSNGKKWTLTDNTRVHLTDVLCQLMSKKIVDGADTVTAMMEGYQEISIENIGLLLSVTEPDAISWARINFPMHRGVAPHGTYLATAPQAFPEDAGEPYLLPVLSAGLIKKDSFTCRRFENPPATVAPFSARVRAESYRAICEALREGGKTVPDLGKVVKPLFDEADCLQIGAAIYGALYEIDRQGRLKVERGYKPGVYEHLKAPVFYMSMEE